MTMNPITPSFTLLLMFCPNTKHNANNINGVVIDQSI